MAQQERQETGPEGLSVEQAQNALFGMFSEEPGDTGELPQDDESQEQEILEDGDADLEDDDASDEYDDDVEYDDEDESDGDEADDDAADVDHDSDDAPTYKVKVAGEEVEVTLDEALSGYMRQQDYTRKTTEVAESRKEIRDMQETLLGLEQEYEQQLQMVGHLITGGLGDDPDWDAVKRENPKEFKAIREAWMERQDQIKALKNQINMVRQKAAARAKALQDDKIEEERDKLRAAIPEWVDPDVAKQEAEQIVKTARFYGVEPEEFATLTDHRLILILRDAMRFREVEDAKTKGQEVRRRTRKTSKTLKPGTRKTSRKAPAKSKEVRAARKRLAQSGAIRDAEAALLGILE